MKMWMLCLLFAPAVLWAKTTEPKANVKIGQSLMANQYSNLYFAGQPSEEDLAALKKQGFVSIVNLRYSSEYPEQKERAKAKALGMHYTQIPFSPAKDKFDDAFIDKVTKAVVKHRPEGKVLVHCGSGNRVGTWLAGHFYKDHKTSKDEAIRIAKTLGLKTPEVAQKYLDSKK